MNDFEREWNALLNDIGKLIGKRPKDLNAILFLIGVQELGKGPLHFSKEQKQDLMHIAVCKLLSYDGYYSLEGLDEDGWPHWKKKEGLPMLSVDEQEILLKQNALLYFKNEFQ